MAITRTPNTAGATATSPQVWAILVIVLGLLLTGRGVWDMVQVYDFAAHGVATEGRLTGITSVNEGRGRTGYYARVRYTADGKSIAATTEDRIDPAKHRIGDTLQLSYLSTSPERVRTAATAGKIGFWPWLILGLGLPITGGGLFWLLRARRRA